MSHRIVFQLSLAGLVLRAVHLGAAANPPPAIATVTPPPLPAIRALKLEPAALTLQDGRDERRVLVSGKIDGDKFIDLTSVAVLKSDSPNIEITPRGYVRPKVKGTAEITITAAGQKILLPVTVESAELPPVRFVRDIEPIISKAGCNQGTCHGSAKGKNGFKLSLRGYDPDYDYQALINDLSGRRFNRVAVDDSLMLQKPTAEVPHEGRQALKPGSREHQILRAWIAEGAKPEKLEDGRAKKIEVLPAEIEMDLPGRTQQMLVIAHYGDGTTRDVSREAMVSVSNTEIGEVKDGLVKGLRRGEAAVLVRYEGLYAANLVTVMGDRTGYEWKDVAEYNFIDKYINAKLRKMKALPSELCTDAEFVRRIHLDLTGMPARADQVRSFLADKTPSREKREKLIDELLTSDDFVDFWANKWADLLQCNSDVLGQKGVWVFKQWIRKAVAENMPYDAMVRALLLAEGSTYQNPAANYLRVLREPGKITEDVSQTFLGVRFNCNKCHDHPFEKWTQNQYYEFGAFFAQVSLKKGTLGRENFRNNNSDSSLQIAEEVVYRNYNGGEVKHLKTDLVVAPKVPFGEARAVSADADRREPFVDWLTSKENPYFARSMANRVWSYYFGKGIIDPVDDIRAGNPPSNPELLNALTDEFVKSGFDLKKLMHTICQSRTYQLSFQPNKWNEDDTINFSHYKPRRLSAEQLVDAVALATGVRPNFANLPIGMRAVQVPDAQVAGDDFLSLFGRPKRQTACECERTGNITLSHALNMINGHTIGEAVNSPDSKVSKLVVSEKDEKKIVEEIYLSCLNRLPTDQEIALVDLSKATNKLEVAQDLAWALLNSSAFIFNR